MRIKPLALVCCLLIAFFLSCHGGQAASPAQMEAISQNAYVMLLLENGKTLYAAADPTDPLHIHQLVCWNADGTQAWAFALSTPLMRGRMYLVQAQDDTLHLLGLTEDGACWLFVFNEQGSLLNSRMLSAELTQPILTSHGIAARKGAYSLCWLLPDGSERVYPLSMKARNLFTAVGSNDYLWVEIEGVDGADISTRQLLCIEKSGSIASVFTLGDVHSIVLTAQAATAQGDLVLALQRHSDASSPQVEIMRLSSDGSLLWHYALRHPEGRIHMQHIQLLPNGCTLWGQLQNPQGTLFALRLNADGSVLDQDYRRLGDRLGNLYPLDADRTLVLGYEEDLTLSSWDLFASLEPVFTAEWEIQRLHPFTEAEASAQAQQFLQSAAGIDQSELSAYELSVTWREKDPFTGKPCYYFFAGHGTSCIDGYIDAYTGEVYRWGTEADANG